MTIAENLKEVRALIADPSRWTQEVLARDASGNSVPTCSDSAVCWCFYGALAKVVTADEYDAVSAFIDKNTHPDGMVNINDSYGHAEVMKQLDRMIEVADAQ